jgi:hypothetical protein
MTQRKSFWMEQWVLISQDVQGSVYELKPVKYASHIKGPTNIMMHVSKYSGGTN